MIWFPSQEIKLKEKWLIETGHYFNYVTMYLKQKMWSAWMQHKVRPHLEVKCARGCSEQWASCTRWVAENLFFFPAKCCCVCLFVFFSSSFCHIYRWMFLFWRNNWTNWWWSCITPTLTLSDASFQITRNEWVSRVRSFPEIHWKTVFGKKGNLP